MKLYPSLLEYSNAKTLQKLQIIKTKKEKYLHIDYISKQFARDRGTMQTISLTNYISIIAATIDYPIDITIHLMVELEDINDIIAQINQIKSFNGDCIIYVPWKLKNSFKQFEVLSKLGSWYDLGEWDLDTNFDQNNLLMLVKAGKSGEANTPQIVDMAEDIARSNPDKKFLFDGGLKIDYSSQYNNIDFVSYSSYWNLANQI
jgi:hypothetical protein